MPFQPAEASPLRGILLMLLSVTFFAVMTSLIKAAARVPAGEAVFFRSFATLPLLLAWYGAKRQIADTLRTADWIGHARRGVIGSLAMGLAFGFFQHRLEAFSPEFRLFLTVGVLGGFTTFSAFSLDVVSLLQRQDIWGATLYIGISIILSVAALASGLFAARLGLA